MVLFPVLQSVPALRVPIRCQRHPLSIFLARSLPAIRMRAFFLSVAGPDVLYIWETCRVVEVAMPLLCGCKE